MGGVPSEFFLWSSWHACGYFCPTFQTLQNHFSPEVAQEAMKVNHPITQEQLLSNFLEGSTEQVGVSVTWVHFCIALTVCRSYAPGESYCRQAWCLLACSLMLEWHRASVVTSLSWELSSSVLLLVGRWGQTWQAWMFGVWHSAVVCTIMVFVNVICMC